VAAEEFDESAPEYRPRAFAREGFVHTTRRAEHLHEVANRYYQSDPRPYVVLTIDLARFSGMWRYDLPNDEYPHLYAAIPRGVVVEISPIGRGPDGSFLPFSTVPTR
jgi:uncharacterized protein (DUF952 family)